MVCYSISSPVGSGCKISVLGQGVGLLAKAGLLCSGVQGFRGEREREREGV